MAKKLLSELTKEDIIPGLKVYNISTKQKGKVERIADGSSKEDYPNPTGKWAIVIWETSKDEEVVKAFYNVETLEQYTNVRLR